MYKDVKKKLLSVALCICMIIGMVQVVPRAKAAVTTKTSDWVDGSAGGSPCLFRAIIDVDDDLMYTGGAQKPTLKSVQMKDNENVDDKDATSIDVADFELYADDPINHGDNKSLYLVSKGKQYIITPDGGGNYRAKLNITYSIAKAKVTQFLVEKRGVAFFGEQMDLDVARLITTKNQTIYLRPENTGGERLYNVAVAAQSGIQDLQVTVVDKVLDNLDTDDPTTASRLNNTYVRNCKVGYNLSGNQWYDVGFVGDGNAKVKTMTYPGQPFDVTLGLFDRKTGEYRATLNPWRFSISGTHITKPGKYGNISVEALDDFLVDVTLNTGETIYVVGKWNNTEEDPLIVEGASADDLEVFALPKGGGTPIKIHGKDAVNLVLDYKNGIDAVMPTITTVQVPPKTPNGDPVVIDSSRYEVVPISNVTGTGIATVGIKFKEGDAYKGPLLVNYQIASKLTIKEIKLGTYPAYPGDQPIPPLYYEGQPILRSHLAVETEAGMPVSEGRQYDVKYGYQVGSTWRYVSESEIKADENLARNMAKPGKKCVHIVGKDYLTGQTADIEYEIKQIDVAYAQSQNPKWLNVIVSGGAIFDYNGMAQTPEITVMFKSDKLTDWVDVTDEFETPQYDNNRDAGIATVRLYAKQGGGFSTTKETPLTVDFEIRALSLLQAKLVDDQGKEMPDFSYTGMPVKPRLKIGDYELKPDIDYEILSYGGGSDVPPTAPGAYTLRIGAKTANFEDSPRDITYNIVGRTISADMFRLDPEGFEYQWDGNEIRPKVICRDPGSLHLVEGKDDGDYWVTYENNVNPTDDARVIIHGNPPTLIGTDVTLTFKIVGRRIDNQNITVTPSAVTGTPNYNLTLDVRDNGDGIKNKQLAENTDYKVASIVYVTENEFKDVTCSALTALPYAGEYEITLEGMGNYHGERTVTAYCGTDITDGEVNVHPTEQLYYNAEEQFPDIFVRVDGKDYELASNSTSGDFIPYFTRGANDKTPSRLAAVNAGTVYVQVKGNPEKGFYGTTKQKDQYEILPIDILNLYQVKFTDAIIEDGKPYYTFTNKTVTPQAIVVSTAAVTGSLPGKLNPVYDYTIRYGDKGNDPRITKGSHMVYIDGTGNFTGTIPEVFYIKGMSIDDPSIVVTYENEDTTYAEETSPTIVFTLPSGQRLVKGTDYNVNPERVVSGDAFYYVYDVTGIGNFNETSRVESWKIPSTPLRAPDVISDPRSGDTIWNDTKLTVKKNGPQIAESEYKFSYIKKNGAQYDLKYDEDYTVEKYTGGTEPGEKTQLTIRGIAGRFVGPLTVAATLYTDIGDAEFSKDADTNENVGTLYPGATVSTKDLKDAIDNGTLSNLISFDKIWDSDEGAYIDPSCYTVSLSCGNTPKIGPVVVTVAGNDEKYYAGSQNFTIKVTGSLEGNVDRVVVGTNNAVEWKEQPVTPDTVKVEVWSTDNHELKKGEDYTVVFENNNGVGLAKVIITGIGKYSGTLTRSFKITYPMSQLTIEIQNKEGVWEEYKGGASYLYDIETVRNQRPIRLLYPAGASASAIVDSKCYSVSYSGYEKAGPAKAIIGEPESNDYKGILLGTGRVVDYTLEQIDLKNVTIVMSNPNQMYTGLEKNAEDLGLKVSYNGHDLSDADYTLLFRNATNTDKVDGDVKATVTITGKGSFTGSVTEEFSISPLPLNNLDFINAVAEQIIYTGKPEVPRITINQVMGYPRTLREGEDYRIEGYTDETKSSSRETPYTEIGTYYVKVRGLRNYDSTTDPFCYIKYEIVKREMDDGLEMTFVSSDGCPVINGEPQCVYNGKPHEPGVYVTFNGIELRGPSQTNPQYALSYEDNLNAGTATVTVTGTGSYNGEKSMTFTIAPKDITYEDMEYRDSKGNIFADEQEFKWLNNNTPVHPEIIVYDTSLQTQLVNGESMDYRIDYQDDSDGTQTNAGEVLMTIVGQNNYIGSKKFTYFIGEDISKSYVLVNGQKSISTTYNGLTQAPKEADISVVWNSDMPQEDENGEKRYKIAYYYYEQGSTDRFDLTHRINRDQIVNAGTYYIAVVGEPTKGTYAKSDARNSCAYTINPRSIGPSYILVSGYDGTYYYTGQAIQPRGITVEDTDLPVTDDEMDPQRRTVKLINGTDYELAYTNNVAAGKASIVVTGKGNYTGNRVAYFNILSSNADGNNTWDGSSEGTGSISNGSTTISAPDIILGFDNSQYNCMMYNGYERIPTVTINGISTSEFIITASNNIRPGVATLTITGRGNNFTGTIIKNYKIKANLSAYGSIASIEDQVYTGYQITPHVTLTCGGNLLNQGRDYTLTYLNNTAVGKATVMATATNDSYYIGTASGSFNISNTAGGMELTGYASSYTYTGYAITPDIVVTMNGRVLNRGTDYVVSYSNNTNVGTATMTVTGIGSFSGTKTINYTIEAKNIENCLTTAVNSYQYTGNTYTPSISVTDSFTGKTLVAGTDYTITYSNNTNPGTASITVTALSKNYSGSKVIPFKIISAAVSGLRVGSIKNNSVKLSWTPQDYADGYQICNSSNRVIATTSKNSYTIKKLTSCTTYRFKVRSYVENADGSISYGNFSTAVSAKTLLNTPTLKARSTSRGRVTLTWSKVSKATGYEIYYSTKKNGVYTRLKTVSKSSARKYVDKGLASGEKYYYTIRAYRTTNGVKTYSSYNTIKSVKVK